MSLHHESGGAAVEPPAGSSRTVVVGYDGSGVARAALELGSLRAGPRGRVIVTYAAPIHPEAVLGVPAPPVPSPVEEPGRRILAEVDATWTGGVAVTTELRSGSAARVLAEVAGEASADEIVVGSHGAGRLRALLGSTSHGLIHEADIPVVVLTERAAERTRGPGDPAHLIVLGYDGSDDARAALDYAMRHLAPGGEIHAVHAYHAPAEWMGTSHYNRAVEARLEAGERLLAEIEDRPQVKTELIAGAPAATLARVAAVRDADEIVVGSRGHGTLRAAVGSVAHAVLHEADRPIVIVPRPA